QMLEAAGEDVRRDAFLRTCGDLAEIAPVSEHDVAQDEDRPGITEDFDSGIYRASRARGWNHVRDYSIGSACNLPPLSVHCGNVVASCRLQLLRCQEGTMSLVRVHNFSISLDGFG